MAISDNDFASSVVEFLEILDENLSKVTESFFHAQDPYEVHHKSEILGHDAQHTSKDFQILPTIPDLIEILCQIDNKFYPIYFQCIEDNKRVIYFDGRDQENLILSQEPWRSLPAIYSSVFSEKKSKKRRKRYLLLS